MGCSGGGLHLERKLRLGIRSLATALGVHSFPTLAQHHVDLHVHEKCDDEGHVEGHDRGVHHEGRVGNLAHGIVTYCWRKRSEYSFIATLSCDSVMTVSLCYYFDLINHYFKIL